MSYVAMLDRLDGSVETTQKIIDEYAEKLEEDSGEATEGLELMLNRYVTLCGELETAAYRYTRAVSLEDRDQLKSVHDELFLKVSKLKTLFYGIKNRVSSHQCMMPWLLIRVRADNCLQEKSIRRLRDLISTVSDAEDYDECFQWLDTEFNIVSCDHCDGYEFAEMEASTYGDGNVCRNCIDNGEYVWADYYETYLYNEVAIWALDESGSEVKIHREDPDFHYDEGRGCYVHENYVPPAPPVIGSYHSSKKKFQPQHDEWSTNFSRWFGVELEVETRVGDRHDHARRLNEVINGGVIGNKVFFEHDGSLNDGFEIITQPFSLPAHERLWQFLNDRDAVRGLRSHNTSTCGLHVHITKAEMTQMQIAKMVTFINDPANEPLIKAVARRYATGYCRIKKKTIEDAMDSEDRYEALNITPSRTIELRVFRGSLKYDSVMSAIEFSNAIVEFTAGKRFGPTELTMDNFMTFVNAELYSSTNNLRPYLDRRMEIVRVNPDVTDPNPEETIEENNFTA